MKNIRKFLWILVYIGLLISAAFLAQNSMSDIMKPAYYQSEIKALENVTLTYQGVTQEAILPMTMTHLEAGRSVSLIGQINIDKGDKLLIKSVFAPFEVYLDDQLISSGGESESRPSYMNDPPTMITTIALDRGYDLQNPSTLRIEYTTLSQRNRLVVPVLYTGSEAALIFHQIKLYGISLLFSIIMIFLGLSMVLVFITLLRKVPSSIAFLWLGLFALSAGIWVFGESDLAPFILPFPTLLYNMAYMGMFMTAIPFLHFGLVMIKPKYKWPFYAMLSILYTLLTIALSFQLTGYMDFSKSVYAFQIVSPLAFVVFALVLIWEHFRYHNVMASRFAPAVSLIALATIMEFIDYWLQLTGMLTLYFQVGVIAFVLSLGVISGFYVKESARTAREKAQLEYDIKATHKQLDLQRLQFQKIAEHDALIKAQRHDLRHHLTVIRDLNSQEDQAKLNDYLTRLMAHIPKSEEIQVCENFAINAVAVYYLTAARDRGINTDAQLIMPKELDPTFESDLCVVIGNLLENALEACMKVDKESSYIHVKTKLTDHLLTIAVDNTYQEQPMAHEQIYYSSKRQGLGTGLTSILAVAQKYGGGARFETKDMTFQASAYFQIPEMKRD